MHRITRGGKWLFKNEPWGKFSAHVKLKIPKKSTFWRVDSIAVGVEMKSTIIIPIACKKSLLKMKTPLLVPPIFLHNISIGSLAKFINRT